MSSDERRWSWLGTPAGETADLVRAIDWAATPVGAVDTWSPALKGIVAMLLHSKHPMFLWWGPELVQFYNDGYVPSFGVGRHPTAMGQRGRDCWAEIWDVIGPQIEDVMQRGVATFHEDALVPIARNQRMEEVYWTYGYSPVFDENGVIAGTLVVVNETTSRVIAARRLLTSQALSEAIAPLLDAGDLDRTVVSTLSSARADTPWCLIHRVDRLGQVSTVSTGLDPEQEAAVVGLVSALPPSSLAQSILLETPPLPGGSWPEPSRRAMALLGSGDRQAVIVIGLSPRLTLDAEYESHLSSLARQLAGAGARIDALRARVDAEVDRNNLLLQAPVAAALLSGPRWHYQIANSLYEQMVGRSVVGREWREAFPELCDGPVETILDSVYRGGRPFFASEQLVPLTRDGVVEERFFDFNMIPIRDHAGTVDAMMVVAVELTAQVRARRELEVANRAKDEFLAMLGHELRNPLSPIVTALALMRLRGETTSIHEREIIERQVAHLVHLVDDLLDVSKVTRGKIELRLTVSDVGAVIGRAVEIASSLFEERGHQLAVEVPAALYWHGDATRLAQVVANLLTNSARYTDNGGQIQLSAFADGEVLVVRVKDNGRGIDAELLPRVFDAFVQGQRTVDRSEGGLGIGLLLVKNSVALHGGSVEAHSAGLGQGSEFVVRIPGLVSELPGAEALSRRAATEPKKVLIVDDNLDASVLLGEILGEEGHDVRVVHNGPDALALLDHFVPTVAVLDIGLPVMDGYVLAGKIRERLGSGCRYVALTGYGLQSDIARSAAAGFDHHLVKPVVVEKLLAILSVI